MFRKSKCRMSVKNHATINVSIPNKAYPKNRFAVPVNTAIVPDRIMPIGCAAVANAIVT